MTVTRDAQDPVLEGSRFLTGIQALVRLPIDQQRRNARAGLRPGTFMSGSDGSPLGGYALTLARIERLLQEGDEEQPCLASEEPSTAVVLPSHRRWAWSSPYARCQLREFLTSCVAIERSESHRDHPQALVCVPKAQGGGFLLSRFDPLAVEQPTPCPTVGPVEASHSGLAFAFRGEASRTRAPPSKRGKAQ